MIQRPMRVLLYCHNALGIGHVARTGVVAAALRRHAPEADVLVVTGAGTTELLAKEIAYIKLPSARLLPAGEGLQPVAAHLSLPFKDLSQLRSALIRTTVTNFKPDVMLVDHNPAGFFHELDETFDACARGRTSTRFVLGLRGVAWGSIDGADLFETCRHYLAEIYDRLIIYTDPQILPLSVPPDLVHKATYSGYISRMSELPARALPGGRTMVVATGSGIVGYPVISAVLDVAEPLIAAGWQIIVALGPSMPSNEIRTLMVRAAGVGPGITLVPFLRDLPDCLASADLFVGRAGYNTLADIMATRCRAIVIPFEVSMGDQLQHSYAVERAGLVTVLRERDLTRHRLQTAIEVTTASPRPQRFVNTGGAEYTARYLLSLASPTTRGDT